MEKRVDRCDIIDVLEEAAVTRRAVTVELEAGETFVDRVHDVITEGGRDWALLENRGRVPVSEIRDCLRAETLEPSYDAKL